LGILKNKNGNLGSYLLTNSLDTIKGLIDNESNRQVTCFYILHALCISSINANRKIILNKMSNKGVNDLHSLLKIALQQPCLPIDLIDSQLRKRKQNRENISSLNNQALINNIMINSLELYRGVMEIWDDSVIELQKWAESTDKFPRSIEDINSYTVHKVITASFKAHENQNGLLDLKSRKMFINKLNELCKSAKKDLNNAEKNYKKATNLACNSINFEKRNTYLNQVIDAHKTILRSQSILNDLKNLNLNKLNKLSQTKHETETIPNTVNDKIIQIIKESAIPVK